MTEGLRERQRSDVALRQSEERYRSLVTATAQIVWTTMATGEALGDQPSWRAFTGQSVDAIQGRGWLQAIHPDDRDRINRVWNEALARRSVYETEYRLRRADGEWRDMTVRGVPIIESNGQIREWVGFCYDITKQRTAEREVKKLSDSLEHIALVTAKTTGQEYFRTLVEHLAKSLGARYAFVCKVTADSTAGHIGHTLAVWAHDNLVDNFEYALSKTPCANVVGQTICVYPREVQKLFPEDLILTEMGVESYCGTPIFGRNGSALGLLVVLDTKPMEIPDERMRALLTIFASRAGMELERLQIDEALRKSEEKFAKAFHSSPIVFTLAKADMRYIAVNETFTRHTGFTAEEAIGHTPVELGLLVHPEKLPQFLRVLFERGSIRKHEFEVRNKMGIRRTGLLSAELIEISGERCILSVTEDITERKEAELVLRRSHDDLERLVKERTEQLQNKNKELEAFSYSASHDLQSPLRAILGFSRFLKEDYSKNLDAEAVDYLQRIINASERMIQLIDDLLEYSRIGRKAVELRAVSLNALSRDIASDFSLRLNEIGGVIEISDLPVVRGDKTLLSQIFTNLFQNAINYRNPAVPLKVRVTATKEERYVILEISDNGIGIAPQYHERIFAPFQRLQGGAEKARGTGLGLANVKRSAEALGGDVWVESEPGKGSTFCIKLQRDV